MSLRDVIRRLMPGITDEHLVRVCDELAPRVRAIAPDWAGDQALGEPSPSPSGTSSGGDSGLASPAAPSTPTPQVGDEWERVSDGRRVVVLSECHDGYLPCWVVQWSDEVVGGHHCDPANGGRLVERDGKPWPPAQEPDPVGVEPATDHVMTGVAQDAEAGDKFGIPAATDAAIAVYETGIWQHNGQVIGSLIARVRQEQAALRETNGWLRDAERERDEAVARAERAETAAQKWEDTAQAAAAGQAVAEDALARVEQVTAAERAVVQAAEDLIAADVENHEAILMALDGAVAAMQRIRDAQEAGQ